MTSVGSALGMEYGVQDVTALWVTLAFACAGLLFGSFLNVCIYRLPRRESLMWPASHCPSCQRPLDWFENVPVVSWVVLSGRCRTCRTPISVMYPAVEVATAALFAGSYLAYGWHPMLVVRLAFACAMVVLFATDLRHHILPDSITLPGIVVGFVCSCFVWPGWWSSLVGMLAGGLFPAAVAEGYARLRGREGMGVGDFKMLAMVGAFLGWPLVWLTLISACILGIAIGGGVLLVSRRGLSTHIPFGTFIAAAALMSAFWQEPILRGYEEVIRAYLRWAGVA